MARPWSLAGGAISRPGSASSSALRSSERGAMRRAAVASTGISAMVMEVTASFTLAVTSITMALIPVLATAARRIAPRSAERKALELADPGLLMAPPASDHGRAIVVGHGRVGQVVCDVLDMHRVRYLGTDRDPVVVAAARRHGREVYYGDAGNAAFLKSCGIM